MDSKGLEAMVGSLESSLKSIEPMLKPLQKGVLDITKNLAPVDSRKVRINKRLATATLFSDDSVKIIFDEQGGGKEFISKLKVSGS